LTVLPISISPESGCSLPISIRNSVDLPAPFGPMMPTIAPGGTLKLSLSSSRRSPKDLLTFENSITLPPRRSPTGMKISCVSLRFWYSTLDSSSKRDSAPCSWPGGFRVLPHPFEFLLHRLDAAGFLPAFGFQACFLLSSQLE
jgi:hypothetical protein